MIRDRLLFGIVYRIVDDEKRQITIWHCSQDCCRWDVVRATDSLDTGRKLKVHKTLIRRSGPFLNVLCRSNSRPVHRRRKKSPNCLICVFQCYTCKPNMEHQLTLVCYVSNIIRAFILIYLMKSEFSERRFLTILQVALTYGGLQYSQETSGLYEFQKQV